MNVSLLDRLRAMRTLGHVVTFKNYFTSLFALIYYENAGPVRIVLIIIFHSLFRWLFLSQILHVIFFFAIFFFFGMSFFACHFSSIRFIFIFFNNNF